MISAPRAVVLARTIRCDREGLFEKLFLRDGNAPVAKHTGDPVSDSVEHRNVNLRHDLLQRDRFTFKPSFDLRPRFMVVMVYGGFVAILDPMAILDDLLAK